MTNKSLTEHVKLKIISLFIVKSGHQIARQLKVSQSAVCRVIRRFKTEGTIARKCGSGRRRKTTKAQDRLICKQVLTNPKTTLKDIKNDTNLDVCLTTIKARLNENGLHARRARKVPLISEKNVKKRLAYAKKYVNMPINFWKRVIFSDESSFKLRSNRGQRVYRRVNETFNHGMTTQVVKHCPQLMIWGCFAYNGVGNLDFINGKMNSQVYVDTIDKNLVESATKLCMQNDYVLLQDNDPKHTSKFTRDYLMCNGIEVHDHPPSSPDLNPIEHAWDILDRKISIKDRMNLHTFQAALVREWQAIDKKIIHNLAESMPSRLREVIAMKGRATKY